MTIGSDPTFSLLHGLRLKGFADAPAVSAVSGLPETEVAPRLDALVDDGLATHREGRISGWSLTPDGRVRHAELLASELESAKARGAIETAYRGFLDVNGELLSVCTDWQLRNGVMNDHQDSAYDDSVIKRLRAVDDAVQPICGNLGEALARFTGYGPRLANAIDRVENGDRDWFAKPMIDSYHTVWFELHEDLLVTLGIERAREGS